MTNNPESRRQWMVATVRWCLATGLAAGSVILLARKPVPGTPASCVKTTACRCCGQLAGCQLPPAHAWKHRQGVV